jgi:putative FmdB family regulatory protein
MPTYAYEAVDATRACARCAGGFETVQRMRDAALTACPQCGAPVRKVVSAPSVGRSASGLDDRARAAGFTKLKRLGKGEYERQY